MRARKTPVVLFCPEGPPDPATAAAKQPKSEAGDTSLQEGLGCRACEDKFSPASMNNTGFRGESCA